MIATEQLRKFLYEDFNKRELYHNNNKLIRLKQRIKNKSGHIYINGSIQISNPNTFIVGNNVHIGNNCFFNTEGGINIGDNTHLSRNITIYSSNHNYKGELLPYDNNLSYRPVNIGKNVWIGMNVCIAPGVMIGEGSIIGIGSVVTQNIPPLSIYSNGQIIKHRNKKHYNNLEFKSAYGGVNGMHLNSDELTKYKSPMSFEDNLVFIVGTGRSGTKSLAKIINKNPKMKVVHEPKLQLISLVNYYLQGILSKESLKDILKILYCQTSNIESIYEVYGESDQKLSFIIPVLHEIFPKAKFIWLLRNAVDFTNSSYPRGWYKKNENIIDIEKEKLGYEIRNYMINRIQADKIGQMDSLEWNSLSDYGKNCWYWNYTNSIIEEELDCLPKENVLKLKIENLSNDLQKLKDFLNSNTQFENIISNKASYKLNKFEELTNEQKNEYNKYCKKLMIKWYNLS